MTNPACIDPAFEVVTAATAALRDAFRPDDPLCPPEKGSSTVRFIPGDGNALPWDGKCSEPFLWVRVHNRYRSTKREFPAAWVDDGPIDVESATIRVLAVEVGVARCASEDEPPKMDKLETEALQALDDSWRIETALRALVCRLRSPERAVAVDTIAPVGPEGSVSAVTGMVYVQFGEAECCGP